MNHGILFILLVAVLTMVVSDREDGQDGDFFERYPYLLQLLQHGELTWAKPIETVDMDLIMSLIDNGFLSSKKAMWFVRIEEEQDE